MRQHFSHSTVVVTLTSAALLLLAACGNNAEPSPPRADTTSSASVSPSPGGAAADTSLGAGRWLLAISTAGGADAEKATTTYITYDPSTGQATKRTMPGVSTPNTEVDETPLLVSADRAWAIPDTGLSRAESRSGKATVYSLTSGRTRVLDLRRLAGDPSLEPLGWAFDPARAGRLRLVDARSQVWEVPVAGGRATRAGSLKKGAWVFGNGFNPNSGVPYVESITSEQTDPAGNGVADNAPVTRAGGTVLGSGTPGLAKLPASPCRLGAAFVADGGTTWQFCADGPSVRAYYLPQGGQRWMSYGKPSGNLAPEAAGFWFALPPQG